MPRYDDDDEDDRPRRRRAGRRPYEDDDHDDYDDQRSRRRRARPQPRMSPLGVIALIVGIGFALVVLLGLGIGVHLSNKRAQAMAAADAAAEAEERAWKAAQQAEAAQAARAVRAAPPEAVTPLSAVELDRAYDNDENLADRRYLNRVLDLNGKVVRVALDDDESVYVVYLQGFEDSEVACEFPKGGVLRVELGELRPGTLVKVRGKCRGGAGVVTLEGCALVK